ncbi:MAG: glycosyltransferase family 9 protein [Bacteriovorax sp.]|nr:glycosyltransferase family 9 protein [Bacteriovorax sp.]
MKKNKVLIIRFSSFGDIVQCSSVIELICQKFSNNISKNEIHWATRADFEFLVKLNSEIDQVWAFEKKLGLKGLLKFALLLRSENFTHVYDAHNNLRSNIIKFFLMARLNRPLMVTRAKDRWKRILLFNFRINKFPKPFKGIESYLDPISKWGVLRLSDSRFVKWVFPSAVEEKINSIISTKQIISLVPSAAWEMKRWPLDHWKKLIKLLPEADFVVLGGKEDNLFCQELADLDPSRVQNLAGKLSLVESCHLIQKSTLVISADTGLLHVADVLGVKALSLMGPTAFGFTMSSKIKTLEVNLPCRPCSKDGSGKCSQAIWQRCMVEIAPAMVASEALNSIRG